MAWSNGFFRNGENIASLPSVSIDQASGPPSRRTSGVRGHPRGKRRLSTPARWNITDAAIILARRAPVGAPGAVGDVGVTRRVDHDPAGDGLTARLGLDDPGHGVAVEDGRGEGLVQHRAHAGLGHGVSATTWNLRVELVGQRLALGNGAPISAARDSNSAARPRLPDRLLVAVPGQALDADGGDAAAEAPGARPAPRPRPPGRRRGRPTTLSDPSPRRPRRRRPRRAPGAPASLTVPDRRRPHHRRMLGPAASRPGPGGPGPRGSGGTGGEQAVGGRLARRRPQVALGRRRA